MQQNKKVVSAEQKEKKPALRGWAILSFVFGIIGAAYIILFPVLGVFTFIPGIFLWVIWLLVVMVVTVFSIGMVWFNDGFKSFNKGWMDFNGTFWTKSSDLVSKIGSTFYVCGPVSGTLVLIAFAVNLIGFIKRDSMGEYAKGFKVRFIFMCILLALSIAGVIFDVIKGPQIYSEMI